MRSTLARRPRYLITRHAISQLEVLTTGYEGGEVLPVFDFEEEARMYLKYIRAGITGGDWRVRETSVGELVSILCGPCARVAVVAFDPPPEVCGGTLRGQQSARREDVLVALLGEEPVTKGPAAAPAHEPASLVPV